MAKRTRKYGSGGNVDSDSITSNSYNEFSGGQKTVPAGWARSRAVGDASATAQPVLRGLNLAIYNNSSTVAFAAFYPTGFAVAANAANGLPIPPNSYLFLNSAQNDFIISSASTVLIYEMLDETNYVTTDQ